MLTKHKQTALSEALEKIKEELMLVGFISLALTMGQNKVAGICVPVRWSEIMLLCEKPNATARRLAATTSSTSNCTEGKVPFIPLEGLHQLHILVFVLAVVHIVYSVMTMALGIWKVHQWKAWEGRSKVAEHLSAHGQLRYTRDTTFMRRRVTGIWSTNTFLAYIAAFFHQFFKSVTETDYLTLRHGFIKTHFPGNVEFDFHKYILRSLEDDFKHVVGISPALWAYAVLLMTLNVDGWQTHFWTSFMPLIIVLALGTKLQRIITKMAVQVFYKHGAIEGMPIVKPNDKLFWFNRPRLILYLIHILLFQNALELSFHLWSRFTFPDDRCLHDEGLWLLLLRLFLGLFAQLLCGYVTLPIYALVSQMGSHFKITIFGENTQLGIQRWKNMGRGKAKNRVNASSTTSQRTGGVESEHSDNHLYADDVEQQAAGEIQKEEIKKAHEIEPIHVQMSYIQRVARSVQGVEDFNSPIYHSLSPKP